MPVIPDSRDELKTIENKYQSICAIINGQGNKILNCSDWDYTFSEQDGKTKVNITIYNESLERMEKLIEMGFTEGFKMSMANLENLLSTLSKK